MSVQKTSIQKTTLSPNRKWRFSFRVFVLLSVIVALVPVVFFQLCDVNAFFDAPNGKRIAVALAVKKVKRLESDDRMQVTMERDWFQTICKDDRSTLNAKRVELQMFGRNVDTLLSRLMVLDHVETLDIGEFESQDPRQQFDADAFQRISAMRSVHEIYFSCLQFDVSPKTGSILLPDGVKSIVFSDCENVGCFSSVQNTGDLEHIRIQDCELSPEEWAAIGMIKSELRVHVYIPDFGHVDWPETLDAVRHCSTLRRLQLQDPTSFGAITLEQLGSLKPINNNARPATLESMMSLVGHPSLETLVAYGDTFSPSWRKTIWSEADFEYGSRVGNMHPDELMFMIDREGKSLTEALKILAGEFEVNDAGEIVKLATDFPISDQGVAELVKLRSISALDMSYAGTYRMQGPDRLRRVFNFHAPTEEGMNGLSTLPTLETLAVSCVLESEVQHRIYAKMPHLREITIFGGLRAELAQKFLNRDGIQQVTVTKLEESDDAVAALRAFSKLEELIAEDNTSNDSDRKSYTETLAEIREEFPLLKIIDGSPEARIEIDENNQQ